MPLLVIMTPLIKTVQKGQTAPTSRPESPYDLRWFLVVTATVTGNKAVIVVEITMILFQNKSISQVSIVTLVQSYFNWSFPKPNQVVFMCEAGTIYI